MQPSAAGFRWLAAATLVAGIVARAPLGAQRPGLRPAVVHVQVADTTGAPLSGVTLTILRTRHQDALFVGTSNNAGRYTFSFAPESVSYQIVLRKLDYNQTARLLAVRPGDTLALALQMARVPPRSGANHVAWRRRAAVRPGYERLDQRQAVDEYAAPEPGCRG